MKSAKGATPPNLRGGGNQKPSDNFRRFPRAAGSVPGAPGAASPLPTSPFCSHLICSRLPAVADFLNSTASNRSSPVCSRSFLMHEDAKSTRVDGSKIEKVPAFHQKRIAAGYLINEMGWEAAQAAEAVGYSRAGDAAMWAARLASSGHVADDGKARGPKRKVSDEQATALGKALEADPSGRGTQRVGQQQQKKAKLVEASRQTYERALRRVGYEPQLTQGDLPLDGPKKEYRVKFCKRVRDKRLGFRGSFSDSKIFEGGAIYKRGRARKAWAPNGRPRRESRKAPPYKACSARFSNATSPLPLSPRALVLGCSLSLADRALRSAQRSIDSRLCVAGARVRRGLLGGRERALLRHRHHGPQAGIQEAAALKEGEGGCGGCGGAGAGDARGGRLRRGQRRVPRHSRRHRCARVAAGPPERDVRDFQGFGSDVGMAAGWRARAHD